ncbi:low affinity iron permease family protein [soil metagenome]
MQKLDCTPIFTRFANATSRLAGRAMTFVVCGLLIIVWAVTGPAFHYSDTWQLVINTSTTIITFLMVFLIQNTQNRDNAALQAKLDELIRVTNAKNGYIGIEKLTDKELESILEDFEQHALPIGEKARLIDKAVKTAAARKSKAPKSSNGPSKAAHTRAAKTAPKKAATLARSRGAR